MSSVIALATQESPSAVGNAILGLPAMMPEMWTLDDASVAQMPIESIVVSRNGHGEAANLDGLVTSIQTRGVLQPLIIASDGRLLAGRRRLEAARRAGLTTVPVRVCEITTERAAIEISLIENVERADLDPLTRAQLYRALMEQGATVEEIAELVGQGTSHIYQHLQLLDLHRDVQQALHARTLSFADARALAPLQMEDQATVLQEIRTASKPLSSRQVKAKVDARRVLRLVRQAQDESMKQKGGTENAETTQGVDDDAESVAGNYALLFETEDMANKVVVSETQANPLEQLNMLIVEMVAAAQGEDQVRAWARRLSHLLESLQAQLLAAEKQKKSASAVQDRLL